MTLRTRLARLERAHVPKPGAVALDLSTLGPAALKAMAEAYGESLDGPDDFLPALLARIGAAQDAGTYPQSLSDADLLALLCAFDAMEGNA